MSSEPWQVETTDRKLGRERLKETRHEAKDTAHRLIVGVTTGHGKHAPWYQVALQDATDGGSRWDRSIGFSYTRGDQSAHLNVPGKPFAYAAAPSPDLLSLIESHHENKAWMPLLDKLVEEYPEHFTDAVAAHTAARQSDAAAQYARAFTATQRS